MDDFNQMDGPQILRRIIEDGIRAKADAVSLEYSSDGLEVFHMFKNVGSGFVITDRQKAASIMDLLSEMLRERRRRKVTIAVGIDDEKTELQIESSESFGETAYTLKISH
jgi:hypothetical protein